ncbi:MAG: sulfatase [Alistipes sp.]|nr:sulfatase [Alistipes sp.]
MTKIRNITGSLLGAASVCSLSARAERPNIVYVFPDQMRNCAMGFWNEPRFARAAGGRVADPVLTPRLDAFAREAVVLSEATSTCPVSSPYRGMMLTGLYPERNGVTLNCMNSRPESSLRPDARCLSDVLADAGYDCAYIGKLHADFPTRNNPQRPGTYVSDEQEVWDAYTPPERRHGFGYWYSYGTYDVHRHPHYWDNDGNRHDVDDWSPHHEIDRAIAYIDNLEGQRDAQKPFLMMIAMNPPHGPYSSTRDCLEEDYALYADRPTGSLLVRPNADTTMTKARSAGYYFAAVSGVDREFGRLLDALHSRGLDGNTIVVFTSDHGETMCSHSLTDPKNSIVRESFNVPFMIRYPGVLRPHVDDLLLSTTDIMPTLLSLAGLADSIPVQVEGRDLSPALLGERRALRPESALYIRNLNGRRDSLGMVRGIFPEARGIKTRRYTFEVVIDRRERLRRITLYDDLRDPYQMHPMESEIDPRLLRELYAELGRELRRSNDIWYRRGILGDVIPYEN